jgi:hypothetical protein
MSTADVHNVVTIGHPERGGGASKCCQKLKLGCFEGSNSFLCLAPQALNRQMLGHPLNREHASLDETMLGLSVFPQAQRIPPVRAV